MAHQGDLVGIPAKRPDVLLHPDDGGQLVQQRKVGNVTVLKAGLEMEK